MFLRCFHHRVFLWDRLADPKAQCRTHTALWMHRAVFIPDRRIY